MIRHPKTGRVSLALIMLFGVVLGFQAGAWSSMTLTPHSAGSTLEQPRESFDFGTIYQVNDYLKANFLHDEKLDREKMTQGAIRGFVESLEDPYTTYFTPDEAKEFKDFLSSELEGIGAELVIEDGIVTVVSPIKGAPADLAGLKPKDRIIKIDGIETTKNLFEAVKKIKGKAGTKVCLTVYREGEKQPLEICIVRDKINVPAMTWEEKNTGVFYISLRMFSEDIASEMRKALTEIRGKNPKGLIIDLRNNGGGFLNAAVDICSYFLPAGEIVTRVDSRNPMNSRDEMTHGTPILKDTPIVMLVNEGSASASEIVAAALKYYGRAKVIGETTYGKATAQEVFDLRDGDLLRITIARWLTPDGISLEDGLEPDIEVADLPATEEIDEQLEKALQTLTSL